MPAIDRDRIFGLALILLGLAVVTAVLVAFPHAGQQQYSHEVKPIDDDQVPEASYLEVVEYDDLPPSGQDIFRAAMASDDEYVVYGTANVPEDWLYPTDTGPHPMYVEYEGTYYEFLRTGESFEVLSGYVAGFVGLLGSVIAGFGGWRFLDRPVDFESRSASAVAVAGIVAVLGVALDFFAGVGPFPLVVAGLALGAVVAVTGIGVRDEDDS